MQLLTKDFYLHKNTEHLLLKLYLSFIAYLDGGGKEGE